MTDQTPGPWDRPDLPPACLVWVNEVDRIMMDEFCLDMSDAGADLEQMIRYWKSEQTPAEFVDWFGEKYDLLTRDQWDPFGISRRSRKP